MCGLTNWYVDPRETAQKTLQLGEASPMGIAFPKLHMLIPGGVLVECLCLRHPHGHCHQMSCPVVLSRADRAYIFASVKNPSFAFACIPLIE